MAFHKINMWDNRFLYRCPDCGAETPLTPVKEHELGPPPLHNCPKAANEIGFDMTEILADQKKRDEKE